MGEFEAAYNNTLARPKLEYASFIWDPYSGDNIPVWKTRYCETVYETSNKNWFWSIKNSGEVLNKLKCRGFRATSLSTYDVYNFTT